MDLVLETTFPQQPQFVRTRSGRRARFLLEAFDEAENLYLIEHIDKQQELRRKGSIEPISRLHSRSNSRDVTGDCDDTDLWESETFETAHVRTKSGREALCVGVEDHGESYVVLEYPSGRTVVRDALSVSRLEKPALLVTEFEKKRNTEKLFEAVQRHSVFEVNRLLDRQADVNGRDSIGFTPLLWSVQHNRSDLMHLLLEKKADPHAMDNQGANILIWALRVPCNAEIISIITDPGLIGPLSDDVHLYRSFLNHTDELGSTALILSCRRSYRLLTAVLFNAGASVLPSDHIRRNALDWASMTWSASDILYINIYRRYSLESYLGSFLPPDIVFLILCFEMDLIELAAVAKRNFE